MNEAWALDWALGSRSDRCDLILRDERVPGYALLAVKLFGSSILKADWIADPDAEERVERAFRLGRLVALLRLLEAGVALETRTQRHIEQTLQQLEKDRAAVVGVVALMSHDVAH